MSENVSTGVGLDIRPEQSLSFKLYDALCAVIASFVTGYILGYLLYRTSSEGLFDTLSFYVTTAAYIPATLYYLKKYPLDFTVGFTPKELFLALYFPVTICAIFSFPHSVWDGNTTQLHPTYEYFQNAGALNKTTFLISLLVVAPVIEEVFFRGLVYRIVRNRLGVIQGIFWSTLAFLLTHQLTLGRLIFLGATAVIYAYVYEKYKSIWYSVVVHSLNNLSWFLFVYVGLRMH